MNMQNLMREAQKMQAELKKTQKEIEESRYEGSSSLVSVVMNGKKEVLSIKINVKEPISTDETEMLEDMIMIAINNAGKKVEETKKEKLSCYGQGLSGLI